jgi:hypothetical protein
MSSTPPPDRASPDDEDRRSRPPSGKERSTGARRPRYLVVALIGALVFGAGCWTEGCNRLAFYRGEHEYGASLAASIHDDSDRTRAEALFQRFLDISEAARGRAVPLAAATFVLGAALLALGTRGMAGRANTRSALMQVVAVQAVIVALAYFLNSDIRRAELDWQFDTWLAHQRETLPPSQYLELVPKANAMRGWVPPIWLILRSLASALILVALSRPRSRAFFEASAPPVADP